MLTKKIVKSSNQRLACPACGDKMSESETIAALEQDFVQCQDCGVYLAYNVSHDEEGRRREGLEVITIEQVEAMA
jgi:transcription elongation factor Elf1